MKPCHYIIHQDIRILIPGCMGAAVYGKDRCTCNFRKYEKDKMEELEKRVLKLEKLLENKLK